MAAKPQLIYVLHGSDAFTRDEQVRGLKRRALEETTGEYNLTELTGPDVTLADVRAAADALPFMADRRVVIVHGLLTRLASTDRPRGRRGRRAASSEATPDSAGELEAALAYLEHVPPTTALVLVEDTIDAEAAEARIHAGRAHVRGYDRPRAQDLGRWVEKRVRQRDGKIEAAAARQLGMLGVDALALIDQEISKLLSYADGQQITVADVELLSSTPEVTIFALLDAIAEGRRGPAFTHLRSLIQRGERPEAVLPRIAATFRQLVQTRELLDQGVPGSSIRLALGVHPFVAEKLSRQAERYRVEQLEAALRLLLDVDLSIKTGRAEPDLGLEMLILELPRP
ncbi:MAG: DNA polymerase III subunit delta [Chloroflexota bacterium]